MASEKGIATRVRELNARIERLRGELSAAEKEREALWAEVEAQLPHAPTSETGRVKRAALESAPILTVRTRALRIRQFVEKCRSLPQPWFAEEAARQANIPLRTARGYITDAAKMGLFDCLQHRRCRVRPKLEPPGAGQTPRAT